MTTTATLVGKLKVWAWKQDITCKWTLRWLYCCEFTVDCEM